MGGVVRFYHVFIQLVDFINLIFFLFVEVVALRRRQVFDLFWELLRTDIDIVQTIQIILSLILLQLLIVFIAGYFLEQAPFDV